MRLLQTSYVPTFTVNLISGVLVCRNGATLEATVPTLRILQNCRTVLSADSANGLFAVRGKLLYQCDVPATYFQATALAASAHTWHKRLGHVSYDVLKHMHRDQTALNLDVQGQVQAPSALCDTCLEGKHARAPFPSSNTTTSEPLQLVHADVIGKMPCESLGGSQYILTVRDDYSGYGAVACVRRKSDVGNAFCDILAKWARQTGKLVKRVRTDGGSEFLGQFEASLCGKGIRHERSIRYTPQQKGVAERFNRTLVERLRCMLFNAHMPREFWAEAAVTSCYLHNMVPSSSMQQAPMELFSGTKPDLISLRTFDCLAFAQVPRKLRSKLDACTQKGIFVGYEADVKGWRVMIPTGKGGWRTVISRDVKFAEDMSGYSVLHASETDPECSDVSALLPAVWEEPAAQPVTTTATATEIGVPLQLPDAGNDASCSTIGDAGQPSCVVTTADASADAGADGSAGSGADGDTGGDVDHAQANEPGEARYDGYAPQVRSSSRVRCAPDRFDPSAYSYAATSLSDEPQTLHEVRHRPDAALWEASMCEEMRSLQEKLVYKLTELSQGHKALPFRWVYKVKRDEHGRVAVHKFRVVAKGYMQRGGMSG